MTDRVIWQLPLHADSEKRQVFEVLHGAQILTVLLLSGQPHLFILVEPEQTLTEMISVKVVPTGTAAKALGRYVGSFQLPAMAYHVFEV